MGNSMSAVMTDTTASSQTASVADETELHFKATRELPRDLIVIRSRYYLTIAAYQPLKSTRPLRRMIAYASLARDDHSIRLHVNEHCKCDLWLASTAFGLTEAEFSEVAEKLGIRVTRDEAQS